MSGIEGLIHHAKGLFAAFGDRLLGDEPVSRCLSSYQASISATNTMMQHSGLVDTCSACAGEDAGSCCMQEAEEWYDPVLLLINLLLGAELPDFHEIPGHCLFLGKNGCKLIARYYFCVNFLCPRLRALLGPSQTQTLMTVAGHELLSGWETEKTITNWLNSQPCDLPSR